MWIACSTIRIVVTFVSNFSVCSSLILARAFMQNIVLHNDLFIYVLLLISKYYFRCISPVGHVLLLICWSDWSITWVFSHIPSCAHVSLVKAAVYHCMHYVLVVLCFRAFQCRVEGLFADNADGNTSQVWGGITFILFLIFLYCFSK